MYVQLAEIPVPTSAQFIYPDGIQLTFSARDHVRNAKKTLVKMVSGVSDEKPCVTSPQEVDFIQSVYSPSGRKRAILWEVKNGSVQVKRYVEIWTDNAIEVSVDVTEHHNAFYVDEYLASLSFAPSELAILYTAEGAPKKSEDPYDRFRFRPDFGEGLTGKKQPTTFVLQWSPSVDSVGWNHSLSSLVVPDNLFLGQCLFSTSPPLGSTEIYATGYELGLDGRLLGVKGCTNRPTGIWKVSLPRSLDGNLPKEVECTLEKLTLPELSCRSPRVLGESTSPLLIWLSCSAGGAHVSTSTLYSRDVSPGAVNANQSLVDVVQNPGRNEFPGLYPSYNLPVKCDLKLLNNASSHILVHSHWGSRTTILLISLEGGEVKDLTPDTDGEHYSWSVLATDGAARFICWRSSPSVPYEILLGKVDAAGGVSWTSIDKPQLTNSVSEVLSGIRVSILAIPNHHPVETIVIQPSSNQNVILPCVTVPHGGPHGTTTTAFSASTTALVLEGYTLSLPNYTGSPGYGEASIRALIGRCGSRDVEDCMASLRHLIERGIVGEGPGKLFIMGGSHGGFLAAHLIGQFPDIFSAAVMRNPVISVGEISTSDIPDWYYSEFGLPYPIISSPLNAKGIAAKNAEQPPPLMTSETFAALRLASPISYVDSVQTPVLLMIGLADRRVSPTQGIEYYHALKARFGQGREVEMLTFEGESHPLDGVEAAKIGFEAGRDWFARARGGIKALGR